MSDEKKPLIYVSLPKDPAFILKSALNLPLKDRVDLKNALAASIEKEVAELQEKAKQAAQIAGT